MHIQCYKMIFIFFKVNKMIQHGQGTSKLSSINLNLVTYQYLQIHHLCIWKQNVAPFSWIFFLLNTRGILARFPNKSSKLSGPFISSLRKSTDGITSILPLPNWNISIWMVPLPAKTPEAETHFNYIQTLLLFLLFQKPSTITKAT